MVGLGDVFFVGFVVVCYSGKLIEVVFVYGVVCGVELI